MMAGPSIVHFAVTAAMLQRGWMIRYISALARQSVSEPIRVATGYAWAALMAILGGINLVIALYFSLAVWAWFVLIGAVGPKAAAAALQYFLFRTIVRRRITRSAA